MKLSARQKDFMSSFDRWDAPEWVPYWGIEQVTAKALVRMGLIEIRDGLQDREARRIKS